MKAGTRRGAALPWATRSNARHARHKPKDTEPFRALTVCTRHGKWEEATPQPGTQAPGHSALCSPSSAWPHLDKGGQGGSTPASRRGSRVAQVLAHIIPLTQVPHLRPTQNPAAASPRAKRGRSLTSAQDTVPVRHVQPSRVCGHSHRRDLPPQPGQPLGVSPRSRCNQGPLLFCVVVFSGASAQGKEATTGPVSPSMPPPAVLSPWEVSSLEAPPPRPLPSEPRLCVSLQSLQGGTAAKVFSSLF